MTTWEMFAGWRWEAWQHPGTERFVRSYGLEPLPVLATEVAENDPSGTHWGWLRKGDDAPRLIYPRLSQFLMCFPYGPRAEEEAGKGRIVRLRITAADEERPPSPPED